MSKEEEEYESDFEEDDDDVNAIESKVDIEKLEKYRNV